MGLGGDILSPPKTIPEVLLAPAPAKLLLAVFKSPVSAQLVPFQDSTTSCFVPAPPPRFPPAYNADVDVPIDPPSSLAVVKSLTSVQLLPSYNSV
jgi:hypothetical protein